MSHILVYSEWKDKDIGWFGEQVCVHGMQVE